MSKAISKSELDDELRPEYDLAQLLKGGVRGKYADADVETLAAAIRSTWPGQPGPKAQRYIGAFFGGTRMGTKIVAKVVGNYGTYTVSIEFRDGRLSSACSCYIGKGGFCHHCQALGMTFLREPDSFTEIKPKKREEIGGIGDLHEYLLGVTLDDLLRQLKEKGVTQKAFAESIGMSSRHLTAIKSSEARLHFFNELGATKLACLWVLEHLEEFEGK